MKLEDLLEVYHLQAENLNALLNCIMQKQKAIVSGNADILEQQTKKEEKFLLSITQTEKTRIDLLNEICEISVKKDEAQEAVNFESIMNELLNDEQKQEFSALRKEIKNTTNLIIEVNKQNRYLIAQSRKLLNEIVAAVFSGNKKSLLDFKV